MDVLDLDRRAASGLAALIDATSNDQFDAPTPCPAWSVRDLLGHLVAGNVKYTEIGHGRDWYRGAPEVDLGEDPAGMYRQTLDKMLQAWSQPDVLERETPLPVGRGPAAAALYLHVGETLVHGWDLARAIGRLPRLTRKWSRRAWLNSGVGFLLSDRPGRPSRMLRPSETTPLPLIASPPISVAM